MRAYKQYEVLLIIEYAYAAYEKPERGPAYTVLTHAESARAAIEKVQKAETK